jgi:hypothetical protein
MSGFAVMLSAGVHALVYIRALTDATDRVGFESFLAMSLCSTVPEAGVRRLLLWRHCEAGGNACLCVKVENEAEVVWIELWDRKSGRRVEVVR